MVEGVKGGLVAGSKLSRALHTLTTRNTVSEVEVRESGIRSQHTETSTQLITDPILLGRKILRRSPEIYGLTLATPRITVTHKGKTLGYGSGAVISTGEKPLVITANHVPAIGIHEGEGIPTSQSGLTTSKNLLKWTQEGAQIYLDFPLMASPKTVFAVGKSCKEEKGKEEGASGGLKILRVPAVILADDKDLDLLLLSFAEPRKNNDPNSFLGLRETNCEEGELVRKFGHRGGSVETEASLGEVLVPKLTENHLREAAEFVKRGTNAVKNVFGQLDEGEGLSGSTIRWLAGINQERLSKFITGNQLLSIQGGPGDSGCPIVDDKGQIVSIMTHELKIKILSIGIPFLTPAIAGGVFGVRPQKFPVQGLSLTAGTSNKVLPFLEEAIGPQAFNALLAHKEVSPITPGEVRGRLALRQAVFHMKEAGIPQEDINQIVAKTGVDIEPYIPKESGGPNQTSENSQGSDIKYTVLGKPLKGKPLAVQIDLESIKLNNKENSKATAIMLRAKFSLERETEPQEVLLRFDPTDLDGLINSTHKDVLLVIQDYLEDPRNRAIAKKIKELTVIIQKNKDDGDKPPEPPVPSSAKLRVLSNPSKGPGNKRDRKAG